MIKLNIYIAALLALLLLNSCFSSGQLVKGQTVLNQRDSKGLKTGHWVEYDTIARRNTTLYYYAQEEKRSPDDDVSRAHSKFDTVFAVLKKEGSYQLGRPWILSSK